MIKATLKTLALMLKSFSLQKVHLTQLWLQALPSWNQLSGRRHSPCSGCTSGIAGSRDTAQHIRLCLNKNKNILFPDFEGKPTALGFTHRRATIKYLMDQEGADFSKVTIATTGDADFFQASQSGQSTLRGYLQAGMELPQN